MAQSNSDCFSHAGHNYSAYSYLLESDDYSDWVVTTAFYSALKFMEDYLFPNDYVHPTKPGNILEKFNTFSAYSNACRGMTGANKHKLMTQLINNHVEDIDVVNSYEDLKTACMSARYINYKVGPDRLNMCKDAIEIIKNFCSEA